MPEVFNAWRVEESFTPAGEFGRIRMFGVITMLTATRKHLSVVNGLARFAQVTVGRPEHQDIKHSPPAPKITLNDHALTSFTDKELGLIEAARRGIGEAEVDLSWQGPRHYLVKIEGLEADGIDVQAAFLAAREATRALIQV